MKLRKMMLNINGVDRMFMCDPENDKLSDVLRRIGLTGVKVGCGTGVCGSCSIILNGQVIRSCTKKISQVEEYSKITTIEGIGTPQHLHPLQVAWMNCGAVQCGFCVPGFIVSAYALLEQNPDPTREEVRDWFQKRPDVRGREEILKVHARNKPLGDDVDLKQIAQTTAGFTGADLENLLNEAAILAAKQNRMYIQQADIRHAFVKVGIGPEKKSRIVSEKERRITAYHEAGHAILFHVLPDVGPVYSVSIVPTGGAGGYTMPLPEKDDMFNTKGHMLQEITVSLGGRVAEEEIFDDITTGASQDIKQATAIAKSMITKFGMSEKLGLINYDNDSDEVFIGRDFGHTSRGYGEKIAGTIDEEVKRIIDECYAQARSIIQEYHPVLEKCAELLLEKEKITRSEFEALFEESETDA